MNDEVTQSFQEHDPTDQPLHPVNVLRALLDDPNPKEESWQSDAGRAVSTLAVCFLKEINDDLALRSLALWGLAHSLGVKEARKRVLKLSRWSERAPPPITILILKDEQQAALTALAKIQTPWACSYAAHALADASLPEEFVADLLKWAWASYGDNPKFILDFYAPQVAAAKTVERLIALLKGATKLLKPLRPEMASRIAKGTVEIVEAFTVSTQARADDDKSFGGSVAALLNLVQEQVTATPAVLMEHSFVMALKHMSSIVSNRPAVKQVLAVNEAFSIATISLLLADVARNGNKAVNYWRPMVPAWRKAYPKWDADIEMASRFSPALLAITTENIDDKNISIDTYAAEAVFARLLPTWDAFVADLPDASRAASLSAMLQQAAGTLGIEALGEKDAVVNYDPMSHHLAVDEGGSTNKVRILRSGVQVRRPDGSTRILVAALVATV
jgi:hypothetical protein